MADLQEFESRLEQAILSYGAYLDDKLLPQLKDHFRSVKSSFDAIHTLLQKKSLLKQDPYNYEEHISEIDVPSDDDFMESEQDTVVGVRLTKYSARLDFLLNYFAFSLDNLNLVRLKNLVKFVGYINWRNLSETSAQPTTRGTAILLAKLKSQHDQLSVNIVTDAKEQLNTRAKQILDTLKAVTTYQRERYKLDYRQRIIPKLGSPATTDHNAIDVALRKSRTLIAKEMPGSPIVRELILEIFAENEETHAGIAARDSILSSLRVPDAPEKKDASIDIKSILLEAVRGFAGCSSAIELSMKKLSDNTIILESRKLGFGEVVRKIWQRMRGHEETGRVFDVEYIDPETTSRHREQIDFETFKAAASRRARVYAGFLSRTGNWKKIESSGDEALMEFLTTEAHELQVLVRRLESLETYFKAEVPREQRNRLSSLGNELVAIKEALSRGRKKLHSYVARHDEIEQLKKLGINPSM